MKISVILCTHNPRADYLQRTLRSLQGQALPLAEWEFLLIDNASREPVSAAFDISWHSNGRHVREEEVGLTAARMRGIRESQGRLLIFVDDDNVLESGYLQRALAIHEGNALLGAFGAGKLEPEFEVQPPAELSPYLHLLALRNISAACTSSNPRQHQCLPWGAGLCVTRSVAQQFTELIKKLRATAVIGRRGRELFSGEDDVFSWVSASSGLSFGVFPELQITHLIGAGRLTRNYIRRLIHDHAYSHGVLKFLLAELKPSGIPPTRYVRLFLHMLRNGVFSMQCQWAELKGAAGAAKFIEEHRLQPGATARLQVS